MKTSKKLLSVLSVGLLVATAVSCGEKGPSTQDTLNAAISKLILTQNNKDVITNFAVAAVLKYEGVTYTVDWTSSNTTVAAVLPNSDTLKTINVTRPAAGQDDVDVVLTAKISATEGSSTYYASKDFNIRVLALEATASTASLADLKTAIQDITSSSSALETNFGSRQLTVVSILTGKGIVVADSTDVIYVYGSSYTTELAVGDNITIQECKAYRYYGCPQITNMTYTKVSSGNANPAPINSALTVESLYQALAAAGNDGNAMDANLFGYFTVTAKVLQIEGKYIVLADPSNPDDQSKWLGAYNYNTDYAELGKVVGATVTVNVHLHDVYKNFSFGGSTPSATIFRVNYFDGPVSADLDDATVAANTLNAAVSGIKTSYETETTITLDSEITWSLSAGANTSVFALSGNTLTLTPGSAEATATLTAKVTLNGTDYTKDVTITVAAASTDLTPATTLETGKAYKLSFTTTDGVQCFLKATLSGKYNNYIDTASTAAEGLDYYLETAGTGYNIYTEVAGVKTYLSTVVSGDFVNPTFVTADPTAWLWDATNGVFTTLDGAWFLGGNGTYTTGGLYKISNVSAGTHTKTSCYIYTGAPAGGDTGGDVGGDTGDVANTVAGPITFGTGTLTGIDTSYKAYGDLTLDGYNFSLSCGNKYTSNGTAVAVGINKSGNLSKAGQLSDAVKTALGNKYLTGSTHINASLEMDFDLSNVNSITYNFIKVGFSTSQATAIYLLRSVDGGQTYTIVATGDSKSTSLSHTETSTASKVRYALVVTGGTDADYGAYARVSSIVVA